MSPHIPRAIAATESEVKALNDLAKNVVLWVVIAVVLATVVSNFSSRTSAVQEMPYSTFLAHPNAVDIGLSTKGQKPELTVEIDRGLAGRLGITVGQVAQSLRPAFAGIDAGDWIDPSGETRDVMVRLTPEARQRVSDLRQLPLIVPAQGGMPGTIPLGQVASVSSSIGPAVIEHLNRDPVITVGFNVAERSTGEVMPDAQARVEALMLPDGVRVTVGGDAEQQAEVFLRIFRIQLS